MQRRNCGRAKRSPTVEKNASAGPAKYKGKNREARREPSEPDVRILHA